MIKALILSILLPTILAAGLQTENDLTDPKFLGAIIDGVIDNLVDAGFAALNQFLSGLFVSPTIQSILGFLGKRDLNVDIKFIISGVIDGLNNAHGFNDLGYGGSNSGFNLGNSAQGFTGLGYSGLNSGINLGNNAFANNFGFRRPRRQGCPPGCYRPMPDEICTQGICPDGCCEMG